MDQLPLSFGKASTKKVSDDSNVFDQFLIKLEESNQKPKSSNSDSDSDSDGDDSDSDSEDQSDNDDEISDLPITHSFHLEKSPKPRTLKFSNSGNSIVSSSSDTSLSIFNFPWMNRLFNSPSIHKTDELKPIHTIDINNNSNILTLTEEFSFNVISTSGENVKKFNPGDRFLYDVKQTKGHTGAITDGFWLNSLKIITSSEDSTFRIWNFEKNQQETVVFVKNKGKKVKILRVLKTLDDQYIITVDDSRRVLVWDLAKQNYNRPIKELILQEDIISITTIHNDPTLILLRTSTSLKLYDLRNLIQPIIQNTSFITPSTTNLSIKLPLISYENLIFTSKGSILSILDKSDLFEIKFLPFASEITTLDYSGKLNQLAVGFQNDEQVVLFNPRTSKNGILITIKNKPKKRGLDDDKTVNFGVDIGLNMDELREFTRQKKKKNIENDEDIVPKQKFLWGTTNPDNI